MKTIFDSAHTVNRVIVTDTAIPYPTNDTSSFTYWHKAGNGFTFPHTAIISGLARDSYFLILAVTKNKTPFLGRFLKK